MSTTQKPTLDAAQRIQIAARSETDPRTVRRYLDGKEIRSLSRRRIERALTELGLIDKAQ